MKLESIHICNYRSISDMTINLSEGCHGFVGINESGKTNILKAFSLLNESTLISPDDIRQNEDEIASKEADAYVKFIFSFSNQEIDSVIDKLKDKIFPQKNYFFEEKSGKQELRTFFRQNNSCTFACNLHDGTRTFKYYKLNNSRVYEVPSLLLVNSNDEVTYNEEQINLSNYSFIDSKIAGNFQNAEVKPCKTTDLNEIFGAILIDYAKSVLPETIYWEYDKNNLLPDKINLNEFTNDPDSCIPLKNMFQLSGYTDVRNVLLTSANTNYKGLIKTLSNVSIRSTEYLNRIWSDYKKVAFDLRQNGDCIEIYIRENENFFTCDQRSDGFKRFVSFLLVLSARIKTEKIENALIIIDEPDIGLHISGQKNLLADMLKISTNNTVIYSTHSIFMIDRDKPERYFITTKESEITNITRVEESKVTDDEVINNALGYSVFEVLKNQNIIFEGWSDKTVFQTFCKKKEYSKYNKFGVTHANGVKDITNICNMLELANRKYIILTDSDSTALEKKKRYEKEKYNGQWITYSAALDGIITLEDFIKHDCIKRAIKSTLECTKYKDVFNSFSNSNFKDVIYGREKYIKDWLNKASIPNDEMHGILANIKSYIYSNLKPSEIEASYSVVISYLNNCF